MNKKPKQLNSNKLLKKALSQGPKVVKPRVMKPKINENVKSLLADAVDSVICPEKQNDFRFSTAYNNSPVAIGNPFADYYFTPRTSDNALPAGDGMCIIFRDPVRHIVIYDANNAAAQYRYDAAFYDPTQPSSDNSLEITLPANGLSDTILPIGYFSAGEDYAPHGPILGVGQVTGFPHAFFPLMNGAVITIIADSLLDSGNINSFVVYQWEFGGFKQVGQMQIDSIEISGTYTAVEHGYYCVKASRLQQERTYTMNFEAGSGVFCHKTIPMMENNLNSFNSIRIDGISVTLTNTSAVVDKSGLIVMNQFDGSLDWQAIVQASDPYQFMLSQNGNYQRDTVNGAHAFIKPLSEKDFDLKQCTTRNAKSTTRLTYCLNHQTTYLVVYYRVPDPNGRSFKWRVCSKIEYPTLDVWRSAIVPRTNLTPMFNAVISHISTIGQYTENPIHMKVIARNVFNAVKKVLNGIDTYVKPIVKTIDSFL